jgi:hypothetical protein
MALLGFFRSKFRLRQAAAQREMMLRPAGPDAFGALSKPPLDTSIQFADNARQALKE